METTIMGYIGIIGYILGFYKDNGQEHGNYYVSLVVVCLQGFQEDYTGLALKTL